MDNLITRGWAVIPVAACDAPLGALASAASAFFAQPAPLKRALEARTSPFQGGVLRAYCAAACGRERLELRRRASDAASERGCCFPPEAMADAAFRPAWDALAARVDRVLDALGSALGATTPLSSALRAAADAAELSSSSIRLNYYGAGAAAGCPAHTDVGVLTAIYNASGASGLQLLDRATGEWIDVEVEERRASIVLVVGDTLERWSGGMVRALPHRVVTAAAAPRARLSLSFHLYAPPGASLDPGLFSGAPSAEADAVNVSVAAVLHEKRERSALLQRIAGAQHGALKGLSDFLVM